MHKDFDKWNENKKRLDIRYSGLDFHEREIWWCVIGLNIGSEQHSTSTDFSRPVLVVRTFSPNVFWGIPLTTQISGTLPFRVRVSINGLSNDVLIEQMRAFDGRRLKRKIAVMPEEDFKKVVKGITGLFF